MSGFHRTTLTCKWQFLKKETKNVLTAAGKKAREEDKKKSRDAEASEVY